jgi:PKD repeat protein
VNSGISIFPEQVGCDCMNVCKQKTLNISILRFFISFFFLCGFTCICNATDISEPMVISSPGIYNVVNDIGCSSIENDSCIVIKSSDVTLNGNGHKLINISANTGIWIGGDSSHPSDVTVQNFGDIQRFGQGIESNGNSIHVIYNQISNNYLGLSNPSNYSIISNNRFLDNTMALWDEGEIGLNQIVNNYFSHNINSLWYASASGTIINNTFIDNTNGVNVLNVSGRIYGSTYFYNNYLGNVYNIASFADTSKFYWTNPAGPTTGKNVVGGPYIAGNYWSNPDGTGWSDMRPGNVLGYTTSPYQVMPGEYDTAPLVKTTNINHCPIIADFKVNNTSGDFPFSTNFTDLSTGNPDYWIWSFGDGNLSTEQNPNHTYSKPGNFTVNLTAFYSECKDCKNISNYIKAMNEEEDPSGPSIVSNSGIACNYVSDPIFQSNSCLVLANFTANKTSGDIPLILNFTDLSTGNPDIWLWDFGDGEKSIEQNPNHTYVSSGNFSVNLSAFISICKDSKTKEDYINVKTPGTLPVANFTANQTSGPVPLSVQFNDHSTGDPTSWQWDFGDGGLSSIQNPVYTYTSAGLYTVNLTVTNSAGSDKKSKSDYINVTTPGILPVANFTANQTSGPVPLSVQFNDHSTGDPTSWQWDFGDGEISSIQNPVYTYTSAGLYTVNLTVTNSAGSDKKINPDYINVTRQVTKPFVTGIIPPSGYVGSTVPFNILGSNFIDGAQINLTNPGQNNISASGSLSFGNLTGSFKIPASTVPGLWNVSVNQGGLYSNDDVRFEIIPAVIYHTITATAGPGGAISPSGTISVGHDMNQTFLISPDTGYQILDVIVDNESKGAVNVYSFRNVRGDHSISANFKKIGSYTINATADPYTIIYPHGTGNYPEGSNKTYLTQAKPGSDLLNVVVDEYISPPVESWTFENITKDSNILTHGQYTPGQVHVLFKANQTVGVAPLAVRFTDHSIGDPITHFWNFGDGTTSTLKDPEHVYLVRGTYSVTLRATNNQSGGVGVWNNAITVT